MAQYKNDATDWLAYVSPQLHTVGYAYSPEGWFDSWRVIHDHCLVFVHEGDGIEFTFADERIVCGPCRFLVIPPGVWHTRRALGTQRVVRTWVHFDWSFVDARPPEPLLTYAPDGASAQLVRHAPPYVPSGVLTGRFVRPDVVRELHARLNDRFYSGATRERIVCRGLLLELLLEAFAPAMRTARAAPRPDTQRMQNVLRRIAEQPFSRAASVRASLGRLGKSYDHQARLFKQAFGVTPLHYVNALRIERAKRLLRDTTAAAAAVAAELGFGDVVYFTRLFKQYTGLTPAVYRDRQRQ